MAMRCWLSAVSSRPLSRISKLPRSRAGTRDQLVPALERGNFDILLNGLELTADNQQRIAMTQPYFAYAQQIITRSNTTGLDRMDALKGKAVGVLSASV